MGCSYRGLFFCSTAGVVRCHCVSVWFICDSLVGSLLKLETSGVAFLDFSAEVYALSGLVYPFCRLLRTVRRAMHNIQLHAVHTGTLSESLNHLMIAGWRIDEARWATSLQSIHPSNWSACSPGCLRIYLLVGLPEFANFQSVIFLPWISKVLSANNRSNLTFLLVHADFRHLRVHICNLNTSLYSLFCRRFLDLTDEIIDHLISATLPSTWTLQSTPFCAVSLCDYRIRTVDDRCLSAMGN